MSTKPKTKRRDADPVRVYSDGRIWYWTGGKPGLGERVPERCGDLAAAEARAVELRARLAQTHGLGPHASSVLDQAMQDMLADRRKVGADEGTTRQYKSNWNTWVPHDIGAKVRCLDVSIQHWAAIFDNANASSASESTIGNISRTLGALMEWAVDRGYFVTSEPFGDPRRRRKIVKNARKRAQIIKAEGDNRYLFATCPPVRDIERYAAALEGTYPGHGKRLVLLAFATGLRISELLALRHDSIDLATGEVHVDWQLNRYEPWPARKLPKGGKTRVSFLWGFYTDVAASLIDDSLALERDDDHHGWLFPRHRSSTAWADRAGKLAGEAKSACCWEWSFHWLRHAYATFSMASKESGGYELAPVSVQNWLGHTRLSTTQDMYVERLTNDVEAARKATGHAPGRSPD